MGSVQEQIDRFYRDYVSIQLVSPASGEYKQFPILLQFDYVSIQLVSPASGETCIKDAGHVPCTWVSIQLVSPASGEFQHEESLIHKLSESNRFPFN